MRKRRARLLPVVLGLMMALLCLPRTALAYDPIPSLTDTCSLTVRCSHAGVEYELYRVCDVDELANFTPTKEFEARKSTIKRLADGRQWKELTTTLVNWLETKEADGKGLEPYARRTIGQDGKAVFAELPVGLYLVVGHQMEVEPGKFYIPTNFMICLPNWTKSDAPGSNSGDGDWAYDVLASNKGTYKEGETVIMKALKIWKGDGSVNRPASVKVQLMYRERKSGAKFESFGDPVTLDKTNGFSITWPGLNNVDYEWQVREVNVPEDYDVSYTQEGANITITNTYDPDVPKGDKDPDPPDKPDKPDKPSNPPDKPDPPKDPPDKPNKPDDPGDPPDKPGDPENPPSKPGDPGDPPEGPPNIPGEDIDDPPPALTKLPEGEEEVEDWEPDDEEDLDDPPTPLSRLPQTGVLWWPVPFLAMGGLILFVLGWAMNRREYEE